MTGDGINDAPALKKADISVVMGMRGTEAAKQAGDMILTDDAFETIVAAVEQGRITFGNIRKSVMFILCTNVAEVLAVVVATVAGWTLPLRPLQILYLNVLTDVLPALALGVGPGTGAEMNQSPRRPEEAVLNRSHWLAIGAWATLISSCVLSSLLLAQRWLGLGELEAVTVSFLTLGFSKLWFTFNLRAPGSPLVRNEITLNPWVWGSIALCVALLIAAAHLPGLTSLLQTRPLDGSSWALVLGASSIPFVLGQSLRALQHEKR
jgi:Ca2+-transporting ATPase